MKASSKRTMIPHRRIRVRNAMSLLEVVLALTILAMSAAILAQVSRQATDNGRIAHRLATAQILCESKMAEVLAGAIPIQGGGSWVVINDPVPSGTWYYRVTTTTAQRKDMVGVRLSVSDDPNSTTENPEVFYIVRWMIDPSLGLDTPGGTSGTSGATSGSAGNAGGSVGGVQ